VVSIIIIEATAALVVVVVVVAVVVVVVVAIPLLPPIHQTTHLITAVDVTAIIDEEVCLAE